jgi:hypothetical protein
MPKKQLTPFQLELLQRGRDEARIERDREVGHRIFRLAKESERDRKQLIALKQASVASLKKVIYNKQVLRQPPEPYQDIKFGNHSDDCKQVIDSY